MSFLDRLIGLSNKKVFEETEVLEEVSNAFGSISGKTTPKAIDDRPKKTGLVGRRSSAPSKGTSSYGNTVASEKFKFPSCLPQIVPIIRKLMMVNPDVSQVMWNIASLGNTGHKIEFDRNVPADQVDLMRNHLINKRKEWATGQAGMNGLVNKFFYQILIGGAISNEWVPGLDLSGIEGVVFINPEEIHFEPNPRRTGYLPYQKIYDNINYTVPGLSIKKDTSPSTFGLIKLNPNTFKYFALGGDTDLPYGVPPYIAVLPRVDTQDNMNGNIDYVVEEFGILGILQTLIGKPDRDEQTHPTEKEYAAYLENLLTEAGKRLEGGMKEGVVVGFKDDVEFQFDSFAKDYEQAVKLFKNNQASLHSALKHDPALLGQSDSSSETQIGVVFIKMLSELKNMQNIVAANLEFGYSLELMLAGFTFNSLKVTFNRSTLQDDLKYQQGQEIKLRNVKDKLVMGLITQDQAADEMDYEKPAFPQPLVPWEIIAGGSVPNTNENASTKKDNKVKKTDNAKKNRQKNKPVAKPNK